MDSSSTNHKRFGWKGALVTLGCLIGAAAGGYFLYNDFNQSGGVGRGKPMAKVERRESKVRRKAASSFAWNQVQIQEDLFKRDSVQTSANSAAAIRFNDGTVLELGENSLVVIDDITQLELGFVKGSVILHTAEGDKRVTVGKDGKAKIEELPVKLVKPEPLFRFYTAEKQARMVRFEWKPRGGATLPDGYVIQISPDRTFKGARVKTLEIGSSQKFDAEAQLPAGTYFWRLVSGDKALTESSQFRIAQASPLKPSWPSQGERIVGYGDQLPVQFRWVQPEDGSSANSGEHELQLASDAAFARVITNRKVSATSGIATLDSVPEGEYYWRIQSRYGETAVSSAVERFAVVKAQRPALALTFPAEKAMQEKLSQLRFAWNADSSELEYQWELQTAQGKSVQTVKSRALATVWNNPASGAYRWRVSALYKGATVAETPWRPLSVFEGTRIGLKSPAKGEQILYWEKPTPFVFNWDADAQLTDHPDYFYQLVLSTDPEFKSVIPVQRDRVQQLSSEKLRLGPGRYYWKVLVVDSTGQTIKTSDSSSFYYDVYPLLTAPMGTQPQAGVVYNVLEEDKDAVVAWSEVKDAHSYELTLYATPTAGDGRAVASQAKERVVFQKVVAGTRFEFKNLKPANYRWSVRAIDRISRKGEAMQPRPFVVTYGEVLGSPEVTSPEVQ